MSATEFTTGEARVRLAELMRTPEFQCLTLKQQVFTAKLVALGLTTGNYDHVAAAAFAYETKNPAILGRELMGQTRIKRLLAIHFRKSELESILADLQRAAKKAARKRELTPAVEKALLQFSEFIEKHPGEKFTEKRT